MYKSISPSIAMSATLSSAGVQALITTILSLQGSVGRPSEEICSQIARLPDLAEISGTRNQLQNEWRRGNESNAYIPPQQSKWRKNGAVAAGQPQVQQQQQQQQQLQPQARYQSKFKNSTQPVEEKILNHIILSKLNKFSETTYLDVREFLYQILGSGEQGHDVQEFIRDFMRLVFRKAASEEVFCPLYARLLTEISSKYSVILEEMKSLSDNYLEIFDEITEDKVENYETFVRKNSEKKYRLGYSQFLAELSKQEILPLSILSATFSKLTSLIDATGKLPDKKVLVEEYTDCLLRMTRVLKGRSTRFSRSAREVLLPSFNPFYTALQESKELYCSCSPKSRFILMDVFDILKGV